MEFKPPNPDFAARVRDSFARQGNDITPGTPEAFAALIRADTAKWARMIKLTGVKLDTQ